MSPGAELRHDPVCELGEHGVPGGVPESVVDPLETVEIEVEQVGRAGMPAATGQGLADPRDQQRPVRQSGQRIVQGLVAELGFAPFAFGDVLEVDDHVLGPVSAFRYRRQAQRHPDDPAGVKAKTAFVAQDLGSAGHQPSTAAPRIVEIVGVHHIEQDPAEQVGRIPAEQLACRRIARDHDPVGRVTTTPIGAWWKAALTTTGSGALTPTTSEHRAEVRESHQLPRSGSVGERGACHGLVMPAITDSRADARTNEYPSATGRNPVTPRQLGSPSDH